MLSVSHTLTGAFIASKLPYPAVYIPLVLASHYLEDWIPHYDAGTGLSNGHRTRRDAFLIEIGDLLISGILVYLFWQTGETQLQTHVWLGALVSIIPDFLEAPRNFLKWEPWFLRPLNQFHNWFHNSIPNKIIGLIPQIIIIVLIWFLK